MSSPPRKRWTPNRRASAALGEINLEKLAALGLAHEVGLVRHALSWLEEGKASDHDAVPPEGRFARQVRELLDSVAREGLSKRDCPSCTYPYRRALMITTDATTYTYVCPNCYRDVGLEGA